MITMVCNSFTFSHDLVFDTISVILMNEDVYMEDEKQKIKNMFGAKKQNAVEKIINLFMIEMMSVFVLMIKNII